MAKHFPLRITDKKVYPLLEKEAKLNRWSVNTLINSILEDAVKKPKNNSQKDLVVSK